MNNVVVHPATVHAMSAELARYAAREERRDVEVAELHRIVGAMRQYCASALADCMHPKSVQAMALTRAIELADRILEPVQ